MTKLEQQQIKLNQIVEGKFGRVAVILEGRDTAGKTGTIRELTHYLPISKYSISLSTMPSAWDMDNWLDSWAIKMPRSKQLGLVIVKRRPSPHGSIPLMMRWPSVSTTT